MEVSDIALELSKHVLPTQIGVLLRLDHSDEIAGLPIREWMVKHLFGPQGHAEACMPHLCVFETKLDPCTGSESNPHYHAFLFVALGKYNALRQTVKRGWTGNKEYSLKKMKTELLPEQFNYICKGAGPGTDDTPDIISRSEHFTEALVGECRSLYWKNHAAIQSVSKKRKREVSVHENILSLCRARGYTDCDRAKIYDVVVEYYRKKIKYLNPSYVRNIVFQTSIYLSPEGQCNQWLKDYCTGIPF